MKQTKEEKVRLNVGLRSGFGFL